MSHMKGLAYSRDPDFTIIINIIVFTLFITWASQNHCKKILKVKSVQNLGKKNRQKLLL